MTGFGDAATDTTVALAERLQGIAPVPDSKIFFTSGGSDSIDTAAKLARRYWHERRRPEKNIIVGRSKSYHGMHVAGTALLTHTDSAGAQQQWLYLPAASRTRRISSENRSGSFMGSEFSFTVK